MVLKKKEIVYFDARSDGRDPSTLLFELGMTK